MVQAGKRKSALGRRYDGGGRSAMTRSFYADVLVTFADYRTGETYVSNARLQLETSYGLRKIKALLRELESKDFIKRRRDCYGNLKAKRYIHCLKYAATEQETVVSSMVPIPHDRFDGSNLDRSKTDPVSLPSVTSSVTQKEKKSHPFPNEDELPNMQRVM